MFETDDPVADFDRWDEAQNDWLVKRPVCADCGEHIQDDHCYEINDEYICPRCMEDLHRKEVDVDGELI